MVGPSGSGKSSAWRVLLRALERYEGIEGVAHVIDPKAMSKEALYGVLDPNTREWTDGLFTHILRLVTFIDGIFLLHNIIAPEKQSSSLYKMVFVIIAQIITSYDWPTFIEEVSLMVRATGTHTQRKVVHAIIGMLWITACLI